jgi:acyl-coenzyme A synthetase/AMP-(fatty) acid ligase
VLTSEEGISTVKDMFAELGLSKAEGDKRIIVMGNDLSWAGGPAAAAPPAAAGLLPLADLFSRGALEKEELFEGADAHETVYLCYSSGTTGKPKVRNSILLLFHSLTPCRASRFVPPGCTMVHTSNCKYHRRHTIT